MNFQGFFSYAHQDSSTDAKIFNQIHSEIEARVQQRLVNATFKIWRDEKNIRLGDKWEESLESAVKSSDVLILVASPSWISSRNCTKEYDVFQKKEKLAGENLLPSIVPIIIREINSSKHHFTERQLTIFADISSRQYAFKDIVDVAALSGPMRKKWIDKIADDIAGIIEKKRAQADVKNSSEPIRFARASEAKEFDSKAYNFAQVDFLSSHDVVIKEKENGGASLYAQFDFVDKMYVSTDEGRVEFGVRRAIITFSSNGKKQPKASEHLRSLAPSVRCLVLHSEPEALTIAINTSPGKRTLGHLALTPGPAPQNRYAEIADFTNNNADIVKVRASISITTEGIYLPRKSDDKLDNSGRAKLQAILAIAAEKYINDGNGNLARDIEVADERQFKDF